MIECADCLDFMPSMADGSVDLVYLDPPFCSGRDYEGAAGSFTDRWSATDDDAGHPLAQMVAETAGAVHGKSMQSYLIYMSVRLLEMRRVLKPAGSIWLHCDDTADAYLKTMMDAVFGHGAFRSKVAWKRTSAQNAATKAFGRVADTLLHYGPEGATFNPQHAEHDPAYVKAKYRHDDGDGRGPYRKDNLAAPTKCANTFDWKGYRAPSTGWRRDEAGMQKLEDAGRLDFPASKDKLIQQKRYLSETKGKPVGNVWTDIDVLNSQSKERLGYPTQKPVALLERIVGASSNEGDLVFDPFCGSGTTLVAAARLGRRAVGCDVSADAVRVARGRLADACVDAIPPLPAPLLPTGLPPMPKMPELPELPQEARDA